MKESALFVELLHYENILQIGVFFVFGFPKSFDGLRSVFVGLR